MNVASTIIVALKALLRNPTRALLTTLGIVIGIAAVITMMEMGTGSSQSIQSSIEKMGANTVLVLPGASRRGGVNQGSGSRMSLTPEDCDAFAAGMTLGDGLQCLPAGLEILSAGEESEALVTLREGKFHQVKRMLAARGAPVTYLRRVRMGNLTLDPALQPGEYRFLTPEERKILGAEAE